MSGPRVPESPTDQAPTGGLATELERILPPLAGELQETPLVQQIARGEVSREAYLRLLQQLLTLHRTFESIITKATHLKGFNRSIFKREPALQRDLKMLGGKLPIHSVDHIDKLDSQMRLWSKPPCAGLIGVLYTFERERAGGARTAASLGRALHLKIGNCSGLDYHLEEVEGASRRIAGLRRWLDGNVRDPRRMKEVCEGAVHALRTLIAVYRTAGAEPRARPPAF